MQKRLTPVCYQWSYVSFALSHWYHIIYELERKNGIECAELFLWLSQQDSKTSNIIYVSKETFSKRWSFRNNECQQYYCDLFITFVILCHQYHIDGLMQKGQNSIANALGLHLSMNHRASNFTYQSTALMPMSFHSVWKLKYNVPPLWHSLFPPKTHNR